MFRMLLWLSVIVSTFVVSLTPVHAQAQATISNVDIDYSESHLVCLNFGLAVTGLAGQKVQVIMKAYLETGDGFNDVPNASNDPDYTDSDGNVARTLELDVTDDPMIWKKADGGINICVRDDQFPLTHRGYDFHFGVGILDPAARKYLTTFDSDDYVTTMHYTGVEKQIRVSNVVTSVRPNIQLDDVSLDYSISFTLEVFGYENVPLRISVFPTTIDGNFIKSSATDPQYTTPDRSITTQSFITPKGEYIGYVRGKPGTNAFNMNIPISVFPTGTYTWYPYIEVSRAGATETEFSLWLTEAKYGSVLQ